jgi:hypothetical protein
LGKGGVGGGRAINSTSWTRHRRGHLAADGLDVKGVSLTAATLNFERDHDPQILSRVTATATYDAPAEITLKLGRWEVVCAKVLLWTAVARKV